MKFAASKGEVILYVSDMAASVEYWSGKIGLELVTPAPSSESWAQEHWVVMSAGSFNLCLHPGGIYVAESPCSFSLVVEDLANSLAEISARGVVHSGILNPHPGVTFAELRDPDGHVFFIKPQ